MRVIDSHTEGEPTRVVLDGGPDLGTDSLTERAKRFAEHCDDFRRTVILEPRGSEALVGALLCPPDDDSVTGVIFFNNIGLLGMCGHAAIGLAVTLAYLNRISLGESQIQTPVGPVQVRLSSPNTVTIGNVPSYRYRAAVPVKVPGLGTVSGDIAWGGNWFYLINSPPPIPLVPENLRELTDITLKVRTALMSQGVTGANAAEIDHLEFFGPPANREAHSRSFVLCPGGAYDRSPCGTGTSAKLACLAADGKLAPGQTWVQESIIGSHFQASYQWTDDGKILPQITGRAYICSEATLIQQPGDPFLHGIG